VHPLISGGDKLRKRGSSLNLFSFPPIQLFNKARDRSQKFVCLSGTKVSESIFVFLSYQIFVRLLNRRMIPHGTNCWLIEWRRWSLTGRSDIVSNGGYTYEFIQCSLSLRYRLESVISWLRCICLCRCSNLNPWVLKEGISGDLEV
jgi:hypothetical protein